MPVVDDRFVVSSASGHLVQKTPWGFGPQADAILLTREDVERFKEACRLDWGLTGGFSPSISAWVPGGPWEMWATADRTVITSRPSPSLERVIVGGEEGEEFWAWITAEGPPKHVVSSQDILVRVLNAAPRVLEARGLGVVLKVNVA